jgi:programmed cell death protein 5
MSGNEDDELERIKKEKLQQLQQQAARQEIAKQQQQELEAQKYMLMRQILSQEGRQRLENIKLVRPQFAELIEAQLIQLFQTGRLRGQIPLTDAQFKKLLEQITKSQKKKDIKIKHF